MAWHDPSCSLLDLRWVKNRPGCHRCNAWAPEFVAADVLPPPPPPPDTKRSELVCKWPPSLQNDPAFEDNLDVLAVIRENVEGWDSDKGSDAPVSEGATQAQPQYTCTPNDNMQSRVYGDLHYPDSIRFLRLHGSDDFESPIHCSLELARLYDPCLPLFEAVSYTWADLNGDDTLSDRVYLDSDHRILPATRNCVAALRRFRTAQDRLLWVDAICINQVDLAERATQVGLMREIYSFAGRVIVYLGEEIPQPSDSGNEVPLLGALVNCPYFSRTWVIQELKVASRVTVTWGSRTIHWQELRSTVASSSIPKWVAFDFSGRSLLDIMYATIFCKCGDPRDKVFAITGLLDAAETIKWPTDYTLTVQQLFTGMAVYWVGRKELRFLELATGPKNIQSLPSWVPDWTSQQGPKGALGSETSHTNLWIQIPRFKSRPLSPLIRFLPTIGCPHWQISQPSLALAMFLDSFYFDGGRNFSERYQESSASTSGLLFVDALRIGTFSDGKILLTGLQTDVAPLPPLAVECSPLVPSWRPQDLADMDCFYVPRLGKSMLLQRHANSIYSLERMCHVGQCSPISSDIPKCPEHMRPTYAPPKRQNRLSIFDADMEENLHFHERRIVMRWISVLLCLGLRTLPRANHYNVDQTLSPSMESHPKKSSNMCTQEAFKTMSCIRDEILGIITEEHLATLNIPSPTSQEIHRNGPAHLCFCTDNELSRHADAAETGLRAYCEGLPDCDLGLDILIPFWREVLDDARKWLSHTQPIAEILEDVSSGGLQPCFSFPTGFGSSLEDAEWLVLPRDIEILSPRTTTSAGNMIHGAWKFMSRSALDPDMPWTWNRDRLWMAVLTLNMVLQLHGSLIQRQVLRRLHAARDDPQRIVII